MSSTQNYPLTNNERGGSRSRSPRTRSSRRRSPSKMINLYFRTRSPEPDPSRVLGVFNLSLRTVERDLQNIFERYGKVNQVTIVYDHRSDRSRGFGFVYMDSIEEATVAKEKTNGMEVNGRNMRVDYSLTQRPHTPTPGEYMGDRPHYYRSSGNFYRRTPSHSPRRFSRRRSPSRSRSRSWSRGRRRSRSNSFSRYRRSSPGRRRSSRSYSR
ncbi:14550_t:CDS:2 [Entrophospora sp. SA101]|nr:14550_t:CDS:2 [Entrophospora sp. SA101]